MARAARRAQRAGRVQSGIGTALHSSAEVVLLMPAADAFGSWTQPCTYFRYNPYFVGRNLFWQAGSLDAGQPGLVVALTAGRNLTLTAPPPGDHAKIKCLWEVADPRPCGGQLLRQWRAGDAVPHRVSVEALAPRRDASNRALLVTVATAPRGSPRGRRAVGHVEENGDAGRDPAVAARGRLRPRPQGAACEGRPEEHGTALRASREGRGSPPWRGYAAAHA